MHFSPTTVYYIDGEELHTLYHDFKINLWLKISLFILSQ
jgi:hypothetical protein